MWLFPSVLYQQPGYSDSYTRVYPVRVRWMSPTLLDEFLTCSFSLAFSLPSDCLSVSTAKRFIICILIFTVFPRRFFTPAHSLGQLSLAIAGPYFHLPWLNSASHIWFYLVFPLLVQPTLGDSQKDHRHWLCLTVNHSVIHFSSSGVCNGCFMCDMKWNHADALSRRHLTSRILSFVIGRFCLVLRCRTPVSAALWLGWLV